MWVVMLCSVMVGYHCCRQHDSLKHLYPQQYVASQPRSPWLENCNTFRKLGIISHLTSVWISRDVIWLSYSTILLLWWWHVVNELHAVSKKIPYWYNCTYTSVCLPEYYIYLLCWACGLVHVIEKNWKLQTGLSLT